MSGPGVQSGERCGLIQRSRSGCAWGSTGSRSGFWAAPGTGLINLWANVQCLQIALDAGADARILDSHNQIRLLGGDITLRREEAFGPYFSLFPLEGAGG